jgi:hypothetical protein
MFRREIVFAYRIGNLFNTSIFNKDSKGILNHFLNIKLNYRQPWGNVNIRLFGSTFLEVLQKDRVELF